jgi:hypothetical protein
MAKTRNHVPNSMVNHSDRVSAQANARLGQPNRA